MSELKPQAEFTLKATPPFNFYHTVEAEMEVRHMQDYPMLVDHYDGHTYWTTLRLEDSQIAGLRIKPDPSERNSDSHNLCVTVYCAKDVKEKTLQTASAEIARCWGLDEDMGAFYRTAKEPLSIKCAIERHRGLHALSWQNPFQSVCIAILLQNATLARTNAMIASLVKKYGTRVCFDGVELRHWFTPEHMSRADPADLRSECRLGFRAERLVATAQALANGNPELEHLDILSTEEAKQTLMKLKGIGEYSAEFVLIGMRRWDAFPIDVWSARQFHRILFPQQPVPDQKTATSRVRTRAEELWGKWRGLVWTFVLHELDKLAESAQLET